MLWALWAAKEGAYKALKKNHPDIPSIPRRYQVMFLDRETDHVWADAAAPKRAGVVQTPAGDVSFRTCFTAGYVHCLAATSPVMPVAEVTTRILNLQGHPDISLALRQAAIRCLSLLMHVPCDHLDICRPRTPAGYGPPSVMMGGRVSSVDISLSHDGQYGAFAINI